MLSEYHRGTQSDRQHRAAFRSCLGRTIAIERGTPRLLRAGERPPPASVIRTRTTSIGCRPACTVFGVAVASPSRTKPAIISTVKPCARVTDSVTPCGLRPSMSSARRWSAVIAMPATVARTVGRAAAVGSPFRNCRHWPHAAGSWAGSLRARREGSGAANVPNPAPHHYRSYRRPAQRRWRQATRQLPSGGE